MKVSIMHYDLPKTNWYADILKNFTYGHLSNVDINYELIFHGDKFPDPNDKSIDIIDFSEWCNPWHQFIARNYSNHMVCTTAEVLVDSLRGYFNRNNIDINFMLSKIEHFIARSSWTRDMLINFGIDKNKFDIIHYGADLNMFKPSNKTSEDPAFLYIGSINKNKGIHHLVNSYLKIMDKTDWKLRLCIGESNNDPELLSYIETLAKTNNKIELIAFPSINRLSEIYHRSTCFCHIQDYTCPAQCSNPSIWALGCGLPFVSLNIGVFRDYIIDGENGFLCRSIDDLPIKMLEITKKDLNKMGMISRTIAENDHSPEKIAYKYKNVYNKILEGK